MFFRSTCRRTTPPLLRRDLSARSVRRPANTYSANAISGNTYSQLLGQRFVNQQANIRFLNFTQRPNYKLLGKVQKRYFSVDVLLDASFIFPLFSLSAGAITWALLAHNKRSKEKWDEYQISLKHLDDYYERIENIALYMMEKKPFVAFTDFKSWHTPFVKPFNEVFYSSSIGCPETRRDIAGLMEGIDHLATRHDKVKNVLEVAAWLARKKAIVILIPNAAEAAVIFDSSTGGGFFRGKYNNYVFLQEKYLHGPLQDNRFLQETLIHELTHAVDYFINKKEGYRKNRKVLLDALNQDLQSYLNPKGLKAASWVVYAFFDIKKRYSESEWDSEIIAYYIQFVSRYSIGHMKNELPETSKCVEAMFFKPCEDFLDENKEFIIGNKPVI